MTQQKTVAFETLREDLAFLEAHLDRLDRSIELLGIKRDPAITREVITQALKDQTNGLTSPSRVKLRVWAEDFEILITPLDLWPEGNITVDHMIYTRPQAEAKYDTDHYQKVKALIAEKGITEMIFVDEEGFIREGNVTNVFFVFARGRESGVRGQDGKDFVLVTPKDKVLKGITRDHVIKLAREKGVEVQEREVHLDEKEKATEIWVTNSLRGVVNVGQWGNWKLVDPARVHVLVNEVHRDC